MTNHTQVLLCISQDPDVRTRDIALMVGITERATQRIVADLVEAGFVTVERVGRRNRYAIDRGTAMRHEAQAGHPIGELLDVPSCMTAPARPSAPARPAALRSVT